MTWIFFWPKKNFFDPKNVCYPKNFFDPKNVFDPKNFFDPKLTQPKLFQTECTRWSACLPSFCELVNTLEPFWKSDQKDTQHSTTTENVSYSLDSFYAWLFTIECGAVLVEQMMKLHTNNDQFTLCCFFNLLQSATFVVAWALCEYLGVEQNNVKSNSQRHYSTGAAWILFP